MSTTQFSSLHDTFTAAWRAITLRGADAVWGRLACLYCAPGRHYHDLAHLQRLLDARDQVVPDRELEPATIVALFFHDAIYVPGSRVNEAASRSLAVDLLRDAAATAAVTDRVAALVATTARHRSDDPQAQLLIDLDLSGLGGSTGEFQRLYDLVRREYHFFTDAGFARRHASVMRHFVDTEHIYYTPEFRAAMEADARRNVEGFLAGVPATIL